MSYKLETFVNRQSLEYAYYFWIVVLKRRLVQKNNVQHQSIFLQYNQRCIQLTDLEMIYDGAANSYIFDGTERLLMARREREHHIVLVLVCSTIDNVDSYPHF